MPGTFGNHYRIKGAPPVKKLAKIYAKFLVAATAAGAVIGTVVADGKITQAEWIELAIVVLAALGVNRIPNAKPDA